MNIFAYRLPGESQSIIVEAGSSLSTLPPSDGREYFLLHPFLPQEGLRAYPVTRKIDAIPSETIRENAGQHHFKEMTRRQYEKYVEEIIRQINMEYVWKVVASRRKAIDITMDPQSIFDALCGAYPNAFVFLISTPEFGNWVGASPELLLERQGNKLASMALAGTRPRGSRGEWDPKNVKEQEVVTYFIKKELFMNGFLYHISQPATLEAGPVEHIMTHITAEITPDSHLDNLLRRISPTPALAGYPAETATEIIMLHEGNSRQLYGGYLGPWNAKGDFRLNVVLRCARLWPDKAVLFAGGGITKYSEPNQEWLETERKLSTLQFVIK